MTAGGATAKLTPASGVMQAACGRARRVLVGTILILAGAWIEYALFWPILIRKLPILRLDERSVINLPAGNARGSLWSGCFEYNGEYFWASGVVGKEGGAAFLKQKDGALRVSLGGSGRELSGGVDQDGRFWAGAQTPVGQGEALRMLLTGRFLDKDHLEYSLRRRYLKGITFHNTTPHVSREEGRGANSFHHICGGGTKLRLAGSECSRRDYPDEPTARARKERASFKVRQQLSDKWIETPGSARRKSSC
jgi:hypothetical protein